LNKYNSWFKNYLIYRYKYNINYNMAKKKTFSTRIDEDILKALKHLAVDTDKSLGKLLEEAIKDLVKKYEKMK
jgi:predicted HicB family RNase H-like nuclease